MNEVFDRIRESTKRARNRRAEQLARFHIGDIAYPLYQEWHPILWGTVVDIDTVAHKIVLNVNGIERQYEPTELVLTPKDSVGRPESYDASEKEVRLSFQLRRAEANARAIAGDIHR